MLHVWHTIPLSLTVTYYNKFSRIHPFHQGLKFTVKKDVTLTCCFYCYSTKLQFFTTECIRKLNKENSKKHCLELIFSWLNVFGWERTHHLLMFDLISPEKNKWFTGESCHGIEILSAVYWVNCACHLETDERVWINLQEGTPRRRG